MIFVQVLFASQKKGGDFLRRPLLQYDFQILALIFVKDSSTVSCPFRVVSYISAVATNTDEYTPVLIPIRRANINPRITAPPKMNIATIVRTTAKVVLIVRLRVEFKAIFRTSFKGLFRYRGRNSLVLS